MEQILETEQKTEQPTILTFEDICPNLSKLISEQGGWQNTKDEVFMSSDGMRKSIQDGFSCIVGEAFGGR